MSLKAAYMPFKKACSAWADDNAPSMGAAMGAMGNFIAPLLPWPVFLLESVDFFLSLGVIALLLAMIFRYPVPHWVAVPSGATTVGGVLVNNCR